MKRDHGNESDEVRETDGVRPETSKLKGDYGNVAILLFLYLLQGNDN